MLSEFDRGLLGRIAELEAEIAKRPKRRRTHAGGMDGHHDAMRQCHYEELRDHGPKIASLHQNGYDDARRKRVERATSRLRRAGLVETWGPVVNQVHVKLTEQGRRVALEAAGVE
jgi:hypothetical protein